MQEFAQSADTFLSYAAIGLLIFVICEFVYLVFISKKAPFREHFLQPFKAVGVGGLAAVLALQITPLVGIAAIGALGASLSPFALPEAWYSWLLALLIFEFWYWVMHWLGHKVRLLWCTHAPHHAPPTINMMVGATHHFLEVLVVFPIFLGLMPALCGVPVYMLLVVKALDGIWGFMLHVSPDVVKRRYGVLEYFMQTPSYHRAHHAKNLRYMDTNYNSITLFWDWLLGTLEPLRDDEPVRYGITRPVQADSYWDVQFGEFRNLWRDVKEAPGLVNKVLYLFMPPGWSHTGEHQTVSVQKQALMAREAEVC